MWADRQLVAEQAAHGQDDRHDRGEDAGDGELLLPRLGQLQRRSLLWWPGRAHLLCVGSSARPAPAVYGGGGLLGWVQDRVDDADAFDGLACGFLGGVGWGGGVGVRLAIGPAVGGSPRPGCPFVADRKRHAPDRSPPSTACP